MVVVELDMENKITIRGLNQNNLKNISLEIPKNKIVVFTGVSGSGKSSIVFDTIAAESQRQMNETYSAFVRGRLPKYEKPHVDFIDGLNASVIVDQSRLGGNARSTVGTITDMYSSMRLLFSRIALPYAGTASYFSFNDPNGMCPQCSGIGKIYDMDLDKIIDPEKSLAEGMITMSAFGVGNYYWKVYTGSGLFDVNKKWKDYSDSEKKLLLYGTYEKPEIDSSGKINSTREKRVHKNVEGLWNQVDRLMLKKDTEDFKDSSMNRFSKIMTSSVCPKCNGMRLNEKSLAAKIKCGENFYNIHDMCTMEFSMLRDELKKIDDPRAATIVESLTATLTRMIDIGLPYLSLDRESSTLSGGEAQRLKLVRYMGSSLRNMTYIFDEPSTGMHPRDVHRMTELLKNLRDRGNTVLVVEHDKDVIKIADEVIDVGPEAGRNGGRILFQGTYEDLLSSGTKTGDAMKEKIEVKENPRKAKGHLFVANAELHNLKKVSAEIPLNVLTCVTGVAGSGKSSLIRGCFAKQYEGQVVLVDQSPITAMNKSTPASFLGIFDGIRKLFSKENNEDVGMFSFNSKGGCPVCGGKGAIVTELVFMDPVTTVCEACDGKRYSNEALNFYLTGSGRNRKNIQQVLDMTAEEAKEFFSADKKIVKVLEGMCRVGLGYLSLGQPLSTLSGGERQRLKLAKNLDRNGNIYVLDEPTTGLHPSDIKKLMKLLDGLVDGGNTVIVIEHNTDVMKLADWIIDVGPDGGSSGGQIVFTGTPKEMMEVGKTITAQFLC